MPEFLVAILHQEFNKGSYAGRLKTAVVAILYVLLLVYLLLVIVLTYMVVRFAAWVLL